MDRLQHGSRTAAQVRPRRPDSRWINVGEISAEGDGAGGGGGNGWVILSGHDADGAAGINGPHLLPHYHLHTDLPEHLDYAGIANCVRLVDAVARELARHP